ncbi:MAG: SDR family NAD(P)-dependent oxidoreductase [Phycisphaerae bacterium]|nr:SDR family NAD(P)-dependent oxidoreductase [Phycisphaerae bacterium]
MLNLTPRVAVITGGASGIARAVARQLGKEGIRAIGLVDFSEAVHGVAAEINKALGRECVHAFQGDVTDKSFRASVFADLKRRYGGVQICVPAAGIVRDGLAVRVDKTTKKAKLYDQELMEKTIAVNLIASTYWAMETIASVAESRAEQGLGAWSGGDQVEGAIVFIGSISSAGNKGQVAYAATKAGLEGVTSTLAKEAIYYGMRVAVVHPGFTDTPMVRAMDPKIIEQAVLPNTQLKRLLDPAEVADAICFMIRNPAVSGAIWADAGWHAPA